MKAKLESEDGKARYKKRKQTVEPVFGIIKSVIGLPGSTSAACATSPANGSSSPWPITAAGCTACGWPELPSRPATRLMNPTGC